MKKKKKRKNGIVAGPFPHQGGPTPHSARPTGHLVSSALGPALSGAGPISRWLHAITARAPGHRLAGPSCQSYPLPPDRTLGALKQKSRRSRPQILARLFLVRT